MNVSRSIPAFPSKTGNWLLLIILSLHIAVTYYSISRRNLCIDESTNFEYAKNWLLGHPERTDNLYDSKTPMTAPALIPRIIKQLIHPGMKAVDYGVKDKMQGRYLMVIYSLLCALYLFRWANQLYGGWVWCWVLILFLFDPLVIANAGLIGTDLPAGFFTLATLYHFWRYRQSKQSRQFIYCSVCAGFGLVAKLTLLYLVPILASIAIIQFSALRAISWKTVRFAAAKAFVSIIIILLVINTVYYFRHSFVPIGQYHFRSGSFKNLQASWSFFKWLPIPVPENYLYAVDLLKFNEFLKYGDPLRTYPGNYFFGEYRDSGRFWYYYLVAGFFKMPISTLIFMFISLVFGALNFSKKQFLQTYSFFVVPIIGFFLVLTIVNPFQIGVRYLLVIWPSIYLSMGYGFVKIDQIKGWWILNWVAPVYLFFSVAFYFPWVMAYTNELIIDKKTVYKKMADTNIDYGQARIEINNILKQHPEIKFASEKPDTGWILIDDLQLVNPRHYYQNPYNWLYANFEPVAQFQFVNLLFHISETDLKNKGL